MNNTFTSERLLGQYTLLFDLYLEKLNKDYPIDSVITPMHFRVCDGIYHNLQGILFFLYSLEIIDQDQRDSLYEDLRNTFSPGIRYIL